MSVNEWSHIDALRVRATPLDLTPLWRAIGDAAQAAGRICWWCGEPRGRRRTYCGGPCQAAAQRFLGGLDREAVAPPHWRLLLRISELEGRGS